MSIAAQIVTILTADSELTTLLTGGIYDNDDLDRMGLSFSRVPAAYDGAILKPCAIVKSRHNIPNLALRDSAEQVASASQAIEIYLYQESGFDELEQAAQIIYELLHDKRFSFGVMQFAGSFEGRQAEELNGASMSRYDYQRISLLKPR